nr:MAG TPA: hypothetical protein [Caudoviricetes sp.]
MVAPVRFSVGRSSTSGAGTVVFFLIAIIYISFVTYRLRLENPAQHKLLCGRIAVCRVKRGRGLVRKNCGNVMPLCFQFRNNLLHGLTTMIAGVPLRGVRETTPRRFFKRTDGQGVKLANSGYHVQHVTVFIVHNAENVLCGILIQHDVRNVGRSGTGTRVSHCYHPHLLPGWAQNR